MRTTVVIALAGLWVATPDDARAGSGRAQLSVSVTVQPSCAVQADAMAFGVYDPVAGGTLEAAASLTVACTKGTTATITLDQGGNAAPGSSDDRPHRRMADGAQYLSYDLYADAARTTAWGNTAASGRAYVATTGSAQALAVYGRIAGQQDVAAGVFTDQVVATITF